MRMPTDDVGLLQGKEFWTTATLACCTSCRRRTRMCADRGRLDVAHRSDRLSGRSSASLNYGALARRRALQRPGTRQG